MLSADLETLLTGLDGAKECHSVGRLKALCLNVADSRGAFFRVSGNTGATPSSHPNCHTLTLATFRFPKNAAAMSSEVSNFARFPATAEGVQALLESVASQTILMKEGKL